MVLVAQRGDPGQDSTEDGLRDRNVERVLGVCSEPADGAVAVSKVHAELVDPTQVQQVIDKPDDPTRRWFERALDTLGKRGGTDHVTLRICADLAISDQTATSSSSPEPGSN